HQKSTLPRWVNPSGKTPHSLFPLKIRRKGFARQAQHRMRVAILHHNFNPPSAGLIVDFLFFKTLDPEGFEPHPILFWIYYTVY
ncbi:MAG: hypothetical protein ABWU14_20895, partial [Limnospira maxima]